MWLRIAIQKKGRIGERSLDLFKKIGRRIHIDDRTLSCTIQELDIELLLVRDDDISGFVEKGVCDLGIVGSDIVQETDANVAEVRRLGFGKCRFSIALPGDSTVHTLSDLSGKTIATSFPNILQTFLEKEKITCKIITMSGSVEIAPSIKLADAIADIVSSGNTLIQNGLKEFQKISDFEAILIKNGHFDEEKKLTLDKLLMRIDAVIEAKKYKYIVMNIPKASLAIFTEMLGGIDGPTVSPLTNEKMLSFATVISEEEFWGDIEKLKALGASGILVMPIEKLIF